MAIDQLGPTVVDTFDAWAERTPEAPAVEWAGQVITYAGVRDASLHVSKALLSAGAGPGDKIPVLSQMSVELIPSILGVLRVGACYAPIDLAAWSRARVESTLEDLSPGVAIVTAKTDTKALSKVVQFREQWLSSSVDGADEVHDRLSANRRSLDRKALVYVTFTSGTTGKPKGVMIYHRSLHQWATLTAGNSFDTAPGERVLLAFSVSFDACAATIWSTITRGGTLVMATWSTFPEVATTCDILILTPSMLNTLDPAGPYEKVRKVMLGAEATNFDTARRWMSPKRSVIYTYGPSEATIVISYGRVLEDTEPNLGALIPGVEVSLVDENLQESDTGEILIGGTCLAAGYLNNPELTAKKFIQWNGKRVYRTGDLARRTKDGLSWIGRADRTVKNRGFLINLETEVEAAILRYADVQAASAFMWRNKLVGFVQPATVNLERLRSYMKDICDPFVVPDEIQALDQLPLTSNGKVDRRALAARLDDRMAKEDAELDAMVCHSRHEALRWAFAKCLQVPLADLDETSSFSRLGGNSLAAIHMMSLLAHQGYAIGIAHLLRGDSIGGLEEHVTDISKQNGALMCNGHGLADSEAPPPTDLHKAMLTQSERDPLMNCLIGRGKFVGVRDATPTPGELKAAWTETLGAHSIYRTRFDMQTWTLHDLDYVNLDWEELEVDDGGDFDQKLLAVQEQVWTRHRKRQSHPSLEIPYCHMTCVYTPRRKPIGFVWRVHHSLVDPFSLTILMHDLERALAKEQLPPGPRIKDYSRFMKSYKDDKLGVAEDIWKRMLNPLRPTSRFEFRPPQKPLEEGAGWIILPFHTAQTVDSIEAAAAAHGVSSATLIIAAWALVLTDYTCSDRAPIFVSRSGRMVPWPPAPSLVAAMNCRVPFATPVPRGPDDATTVADWLARMHASLLDVAELENLCQSLDPALAPPGYFNTAVQAFLRMPRGPGNWEMGDRLTGQPKPLGMVWRLESAGEEGGMKVELEIDRRVVDAEWAREVGERAIERLRTLVTAPRASRVQDLRGE